VFFLQRFLRTWGSLVKALPNKIILLYWKGQEIGWVATISHCLIERDLTFMTEGTTNTIVELVNLIKRHNNPWMNRRVRSTNLSMA
jgi:lipid-A-disaccharide synthase-like uncharacterized protein